ncbi:MAG: hypothetical protein M1823_001829 [Watsoniomyces obsoletus]|nr:MAG: hypothetical protein M1823_001829 [Watsoniomyces obsoletus]
MSEPDTDYLAPNFDPSTLTVPRLRAILVQYDVDYPASAKKAQLVEIFNETIAPRSRKILAAHSRTKRTSKGITDVESSQESSKATGDDETANGASLEPTVDASRTNEKPRATRRAARVTESEFPEVPPMLPIVRGLADQRASYKHPRGSDADLTAGVEAKRPMVRKTRRSEGMPPPEEPNLERQIQRKLVEDSVFSDDNPFQSGSSPLGGETDRRISGGRRRKSMGPLASKDPARRKTTGRAEQSGDGFLVPKASKFEVDMARGVSKSKREEAPTQPDAVEAGEEFTVEEQMELLQEEEETGVPDVLPPRRSIQYSNGGAWSRSAPWVILTTLLGGYAAWWRQEKVEVGYCGIGRTSTHLGQVLPDWASVLEPTCEPCPQHAYCYANLQTTCESNFILKPHPLSLGGLIPLVPTCEPDGERVRKIKSVADRAVGELRERRAQYECGELRGEHGKAARPGMDEEQVKTIVGQKRRKTMSNAEFEELWTAAIGEVLGRDEVVSEVDSATGSRILSSNSLARLRLACALRRSVRLALARHRVELGSLIAIIIAVLSARSYIISSRQAKAQVPELVRLTLDRLATQAALHAQNELAVPEPWISISQLRDDVLRDEFSARRRKELWRPVEKVVEMNANVRASVRENRGGEVSRVWEWIGSVGNLEDGSSGGARRQSGRFSLGSVAPESSPTPPVYSVESSRPDTARRWDEGRPVF